MTSPLPLAGHQALVTGGSGGIGSACAARLLRDGCTVTLGARGADALAAAAGRLRAQAPVGAEVRTVVMDGCLPKDVQAAVAAARGDAGKLDICVATVGGGSIGPILATDDEQFMSDLRINLSSAFLAIKYAGAAIAAGGGGSIVAISTTAARMHPVFMPGYSAGKAGLEALLRVAANELGPLGVRVNAVRPGLTRSQEDSAIFRDPALVAEFLANKPLGRTGVPEDIAEAVRYLAGPEASWTTGQSIAVDGGNEMRTMPSFEKFSRAVCGDEAVDAALAGRIPGADNASPAS